MINSTMNLFVYYHLFRFRTRQLKLAGRHSKTKKLHGYNVNPKRNAVNYACCCSLLMVKEMYGFLLLKRRSW